MMDASIADWGPGSRKAPPNRGFSYRRPGQEIHPVQRPFRSMTPTTIAWSATLFCVVFSARMADGFLRASPRLFTVVALFACNWAVLLPYYGLPTNVPRPELLSALGGFLSIYAGGLLMLHAHQPRGPAPDVVTWQVIGVNLLLLVAVGIGTGDPWSARRASVRTVASSDRARGRAAARRHRI